MKSLDEDKQKAKLNEAISRIQKVSPRLNFAYDSGNVEEVIKSGVEIIQGKIK